MPSAHPLPDRRALAAELSLIGRDFQNLRDPELFVAWFVLAYLTGDRQQAVESLTGGASEKGVDAVYIDRRAKVASLVQGKYSQRLLARAENRDAVQSIALLPQQLLGTDEGFAEFCNGMEPIARRKVTALRKAVLDENYRLTVYFATLNRVSPAVRRDATHTARQGLPSGIARPQMIISDGRNIVTLLADYLDGVAPPVPRAELLVEKPPAEEYDGRTGVSSWSFAVSGLEIARLFDHAGRKLFARNIRGFLGEKTPVNQEMRATLRREPQKFWYLNNGITIICDAVSLESEAGEHRIALTNPQIINGQQTTYSLASDRRGATKARVSIRAIGLPRGPEAEGLQAYEEMVASVVRATNSQNQIRPSDLISNDRIQVRVERELHKRNYHYQRKRAARGELGGEHYQWGLSKYDVARAVMTCESSTTVLNEGREALFENPLYERIFDRPIDRLLTHVWFYRHLESVARGRSDWQWAKFVVVEFMWSDLSPFLLQRQRAFIEMSEQWPQPAARGELARAGKRALQAATKHFRDDRGTGSVRLEISPFFKQRGRFREFERYWRSQRNPHRRHYRVAVDRFKHDLAGSRG